jgi:hypothetical protein
MNAGINSLDKASVPVTAGVISAINLLLLES